MSVHAPPLPLRWLIVTRNRPRPEAQGCPRTGCKGDRGLQASEGGRVQGLRGVGTPYNRLLSHSFLNRVPYVITQHAGSTQTAQAAIDQETKIKLQEITDAYNKNKDQVVKKLLDRVVLVKPELHRNLKKVQA